MSATVVFITGASSGIGAALKRSVPFEGARTIGVSRRAGPGEDLSLDLAEPAGWRSLALHFESVMPSGAQRAVLLHFAGTPGPSACMTEAALDEYTQYWVRSVAAEGGGTVFAVVPFAVDAPMLREVMEQPDDEQPLAATFREAAARGELATSDAPAAEIWEAVLAGVPNGSVVPVGAVPASDLQPEAV
jgi:NAD(P)-dependent dehydrogenase (short-subunit alcohol dehydrogenase family)